VIIRPNMGLSIPRRPGPIMVRPRMILPSARLGEPAETSPAGVPATLWFDSRYHITEYVGSPHGVQAQEWGTMPDGLGNVASNDVAAPETHANGRALLVQNDPVSGQRVAGLGYTFGHYRWMNIAGAAPLAPEVTVWIFSQEPSDGVAHIPLSGADIPSGNARVWTSSGAMKPRFDYFEAAFIPAGIPAKSTTDWTLTKFAASSVLQEASIAYDDGPDYFNSKTCTFSPGGNWTDIVLESTFRYWGGWIAFILIIDQYVLAGDDEQQNVLDHVLTEFPLLATY